MTAPVGLGDRLSGATPPELAAFAAACATRMTPVFDYFALTGAGRFRDWVAELWTAARASDTTRARALLQQINPLPEAAGGADSNRPDYYAVRAAGVLFYAVTVLLDDDQAAAAFACSQEARSLLYGFDYLLQIPDNSAGSLEQMESRAQHEWLDRHASAPSTIDGDLAAAASASAVVGQLAEAAPAVAEVRGWDMRQWRSG